MNKRILADTSVWVEFFRPSSAKGKELEKLLTEDAIWTCGTVLFELAQGVKSEAEKKYLLDIFSDLPYIEMTASLWFKAGALAASLNRHGLTLPNSDIFIASLAIENNLSVFTLDSHFAQIPGVKLFSTSL
jgi:predicted nucleic acid-binding protein